MLTRRAIEDVHAQLSHGNASVSLLRPIAILPNGTLELRARDDNLADGNTRRSLEWLHDGVDPRIQTKDQARVVAVEDEVASGD